MITLCTSAYEKDFRHTLNKNNWFYKVENPLITKKVVIVNNIDNIEEFSNLKKEFENDFEFHNSSEFIEKINENFDVLLSPNDISHYYSIHHYTSLLVNNNEYGFHVSPDCWIVGEDISDYLKDSMELLNSDESIKSTTIFWVPPKHMESVGHNEETYYNIQKKHEKFYLSKVFCDQIYFYKKDTFLNCSWTNTDGLHPNQPYGRNSFEERLTSYYIVQNNYRAIYKSDLHFTHVSF